MNFNLSPVFCAHNGVLILEQINDAIVIGMIHIDNTILIRKIESRYSQFLRQQFGEYVSKKQVQEHISYKEISKEFFIRETSRELVLTAPSGTSSNETIQQTESLSELIEDAPIIHLLNSLLLDCIDKNGSDVHIEPSNNGSRIRMRILGELELYSTIDTSTAEALILRILFLAGLDIAENRRSQDGSFHFEAGNVDADIRVSVLPSQMGSSCVLRILSSKNFELSFLDLGFSPCHIDFLESVCCKTNSLVLVCGATGAGKSTTLAAMLNRLKCDKKKIITIEDPVEYRVDGVVQVPVNPVIEMDFPQVLRSSFRHDPDVIMIGEIRDELTARIAVRSALTGHLVLASLHTIDAPSSIIRLLDMGIENWLLASVFGGAICQRLIKKYDGEKCHYLPIAEMLPACSEVFELILKKSDLYEYRDFMSENNIMSMREEAEYAICI